MAQLFSDEDFDFRVVRGLRNFGHDVLTTLQVGLAGKQTPGAVLLALATSLGRAILTHDRDYKALHRHHSQHAGILLCSQDLDSASLTTRLDQAVMANLPLDGKLIRVYKPVKP